jgi:hypothetical protein
MRQLFKYSGSLWYPVRPAKTWNEIMRCVRSWLQCVSRLRSFHCHQVRSKRERHRPFAARFAGNIGPRSNSPGTGKDPETAAALEGWPRHVCWLDSHQDSIRSRLAFREVWKLREFADPDRLKSRSIFLSCLGRGFCKMHSPASGGVKRFPDSGGSDMYQLYP